MPVVQELAGPLPATPGVQEQWWAWEMSSSTSEVPRVCASLAEAGYPERDRYAMRLALEEAVLNAVRHGNQSDPSRRVQVEIRLDADRVLAEVEDEGAGFDPRKVPDPTDPANLERPGGRGLLLMRHYATWLRFNERGNRVTLCRCRSDP
jgi:serine/threonine-protein kinase RsbW